jgi:metal-dependent amidase/aminoacylase/carboxypeptidase family protein
VIDQIKSLNLAFFDEIQSFRRHLHQHPELSWQEQHTTKYITDFLQKHKISYTKPTKTGVIAIIEVEIPLLDASH